MTGASENTVTNTTTYETNKNTTEAIKVKKDLEKGGK